MSKVITGVLHSKNGGCIDWGWHGFVAYGCHSFVVVIHAKTMTAVQTLPGHVGKVRWSREDSLRNATDFHDWYLRLASADSLGRIVVWNVLQAQMRCEFGESNAAVVDMQWLCCQDASPDLLLALHGPATLILWNGDQGTQLWRVAYTDVFIGFSIDPFQLSRIAFLNAAGNLLLIEDFSVSTTPSGQTTKQYRLTQANEATTINMPESVADFHSKRSAVSLSIKNQLVKALGSSSSVSIGNNAKINNSSDNTNNNNSSSNSNNNSNGSSNSNNNNDNSMVEWSSMMNSDEVTTSSQHEICCRQLVYQPSRRGHLFLVYSREIVLINVDRMLPVLHLTFDRGASAVLCILPCRQRDAFYMCQENGGLSLRACRYSNDGAEVDKPVTMFYETVCYLENQRHLVKSWFPVGVCLAPDCELRLVAVMGNGRLCRYDVEPIVEPAPTSSALSTWYTLSQLASQWNQWAWPARLTLACVRYPLGGSPTIVRSCPSRGRNGEQLILVGNQDGVVQLVDADRGELERDFGLHSCPVVCLEWVGVDHFVSCACLQNFTASSTHLVRNELFYVDIRSGRAKILRPECDESAIEMIKVSHFYSYLAIAFRRQPMEIWDLKSFRLLKKMSRRCPIVVDMAWSTKHHHVQRLNVDIDAGGLVVDSKEEMNDLDNDETTQGSSSSQQQQQSSTGVLYRENLVVLDHENHLWHVVVKGLHVKDGCEVQTQWTGTSGQMSAMAWKEDLLVFGDSDGRFCAWNLQCKTSSCKSSDLGEIRSLQFCPRPADFTVLALQAEGASVWNPHKLICLSKLRLDTIGLRVLDLSLLESGVPILLTTDGCARVYDAGFSTLASNNERLLVDRLFCPTLCSKHLTALLKYTLLEQVALDEPVQRLFETVIERLEQSSIDELQRSILLKQFHCLGEQAVSGVVESNSSNVIGRCRRVAQLFGEQWEENFWTVVQDALEPLSNKTVRVPNCLDYLFPSEQFRRVEWAALSSSICESNSICSSTSDGGRQRRNHVATLVLLGRLDTAMQLLLAETANPSHADHYENSLKACLLAADRSSTNCRSTIKLVATNCIAAGRLLDGIWLLCLIDKQLDACRYLQSFGYWEQSVWLAKVALDEQHCAEVMLKWAEHLSSTESCQKTLTLLVLAFLKQWDMVVQMLLDIGQTVVAWLLVRAIQRTTDDNSIKPDSLDRLNKSIQALRIKYGYTVDIVDAL
ncbi:WD repeat-containing protein 11 [Trichinella pseudospiralis]|uniref:WD repeat-containing protein 11 n=1 Tax=Trichinella pseudospiralis TaxID=6337 RepID=A0A0V1FP76_TRIPS|nr:WD repeat-containing protein 11 [Trichinella pseudospiralis]